MRNNNLTLSDLGEKKIISEIIRKLPLENKGELLLNDDAQIIPVASTNPIFISTDRTPTDLKALCLGVMSLFEYGRYCVISNLSDIAAMGAFPTGFLLNIAASPDMTVDDFEQVMQGVTSALNEYKIPLLGGDTKEAKQLNLVGIALGQSYTPEFFTRSGAKPGDYLIISKGFLGLTPTAFEYFNIRDSVSLNISATNIKEMISSLVDVKARFSESKILSVSKLCTSCMDNTDGLYSSFLEIVDASQVGLEIDLSNINIHNSTSIIAEKSDKNIHELILSAGADFKLISTVRRLNNDIEESFQVIGRVNDKSQDIFISGLNENALEKISRWNHFKSK